MKVLKTFCLKILSNVNLFLFILLLHLSTCFHLNVISQATTKMGCTQSKATDEKKPVQQTEEEPKATAVAPEKETNVAEAPAAEETAAPVATEETKTEEAAPVHGEKKDEKKKEEGRTCCIVM